MIAVGGVRLITIGGGNLYNSDRVRSEYIAINNCGLTIAGQADSTTLRPRGRSDYLLLYVWEGMLRLQEARQRLLAPAGSVVVYRPGERQHYTHVAQERTQVYWLHFSGTGAEDLLQKAGFSERIAPVGCVPEARELLRRLIHELQFRQEQYEMFCQAQILLLLATLSRGRQQRENAPFAQKYRRLSAVIGHMHANCQQPLSVGDFAQMCDLSEYHFIHLFHEYTGEAPYAYLTRLRLEKAKDLMVSTTLNISEIAAAVGYPNPLYFSRLFRRHMGASPSQFRKAMGN